MQPVIILMVVMLHVAFGCMFLFMYRQHPARYSRLIAQSWLLEAFRASINFTQLVAPSAWSNHWYGFSDCLSVLATWWLVAGCADLAGVRLPARLGRIYLWSSVPVILLLRYGSAWVGVEFFGAGPAESARIGIFIAQIVIFLPVTVLRCAILLWFIRIWRTTRLPGAMLAMVFIVPYVIFAVVNPAQFYFSYYPDWIFIVWAGRVLGFSLGLLMLVFDRHLAEQRSTEETAQHLAKFPELNPNPVLEFGADATLAYHNPAAREIAPRLGYPGMAQLLPLETRAIIAECLATGQPRLQLLTTHGRNTLAWSFYPIVRQRVVHCYVEDTTGRTLLEEQLRQAQKMEAVGQLAGGVAHDFNNLLTAILGHLGLLRTSPAMTPDTSESIEEIARAANRAAGLTSQLLSFSRRQVITVRVLDLNELVNQLAKMLRRLLGEQVRTELELDAGRLPFSGDTGMIEQVVINLALNARDAMPSGGTLTIATSTVVRRPPAPPGQAGESAPAKFVCLAVSDTGIGIAPEIRAKIFEPFFTTKAVGQGTGLGLATAFGIIQQHRGWIEVESEPGRGALFRVYLPQVAATELPVAIPEPAPPAVPGEGETILLVEDEHSVRDIGVRVLTRRGYRVLAAADGPEALEIWRKHRNEIRLLFTDIIMPGGLTGLQLARQLLAERPDLPVIYTSGYSREIAGRELSIEEGVNYLAKPYELDRLFNLVRATLDARPPSSPDGRGGITPGS